MASLGGMVFSVEASNSTSTSEYGNSSRRPKPPTDARAKPDEYLDSSVPAYALHTRSSTSADRPASAFWTTSGTGGGRTAVSLTMPFLLCHHSGYGRRPRPPRQKSFRLQFYPCGRR